MTEEEKELHADGGSCFEVSFSIHLKRRKLLENVERD